MPCISSFTSELKHLYKTLKSLKSSIKVIKHSFDQNNDGKTQYVTLQLPGTMLFTIKIHKLLILDVAVKFGLA
jgi:hypothetical protein